MPLRTTALLTLLALIATPAAQAQQKMYFTGNGNGPDTIRCADLTGNNIQVLVQGLQYPQAVALDTVARNMYWTDSGAVHRASMSGSGRAAIVSGLGSPRGIAVDAAGGKIYWADLTRQKIQRADLNAGASHALSFTAGLRIVVGS